MQPLNAPSSTKNHEGTRFRATGAALLVVASFELAIHETALAPDAGDFDGDRLPLSISLVMRHTGG